ncbi:GntR family transcriptional regulator [Vagococcus elongatus]|uniref:GntR family transcriptional regulator n=1 Tax=Vagococcus elongatus TaxID=180344 RepID=A0A430APY0_9ENTE|nr:GntR family transcriptional regulator [Vagococcus elongatus]RSU09974.1 GntR family transcriptional regulator [Vagococcus elongatus]
MADNIKVRTEKIDYASPLYLQVRSLVQTKIENKEYLPGTAIPSDNEFAKALGVNRLTINAALEGLVSEGVLRRVQGKGSFVVGEKISRDLERLQGFTQTMDGRNIDFSVKVLKKHKRRAGKFYGLIFDMDPEKYLYYIERLCYIGEEVLSVEEIFVLDELVPKLEGIDLSVFSLFEIYGFYGIELKEAEQTLEIVRLDKREAKLLKMEENESVLMVECKTYDTNEQLIEFSRNFTRSDYCDYTVHFKR